MTPAQLLQHRLRSQCLAATAFSDPADVVRWLGAVQAQDYLGALWAIGLRTRGATERSVEQAIARGEFVRTWPMRSTLHFVAAADVRWMLSLLGARVVAANAPRLAKDFGLEERTVGRAGEVASRALEGRRRLTRDALYRAWDRARISTAGGRGSHLVGRLAQGGVTVSARERASSRPWCCSTSGCPQGHSLPRDEALAQLAGRYVASHGPATTHDLAWWSGLTVADATRAIDLVRGDIESEHIEGRTYWLPRDDTPARATSRALLLPAFDELTVAYRDRSHLVSAEHARRADGMGLLSAAMVVSGRVVGHWARTLGTGSVGFTWKPFAPLQPVARRSVGAAARRYAAFLGVRADAA